MSQGAVIGGGIAGLAVGLFAQQRGISLPVYEKQPHLNCQDNLLWLAPNGLHLLDALGLLNEVLSHGVAQEAMSFASKDLRPIMTLDGPKMIKTNGHTITAIRRGDLYGLMLARFRAGGGKVHYRHELTGLTQTAADVRLEFAEQGAMNCSFVIGADGIGSATRRLVFPTSHVKYQGLRTYLGRSKTPVSQHFVGRTIETWGMGTRFVLTSLDGVYTYWSAIERPLTYAKNSAPLPVDLQGELRQAFASYHADIRCIVEEADLNSIHRCNFGVVAGLPRSYDGRVCLIGDAAHGMPPNMGQGASLALEDAFLLAAGLEHNNTAPDFAALDRARKPRVKQMMQIANGMNGMFQPRSRLGSAVRDSVFKALPDALSQWRMARIYAVPFPLATPAVAAAGGKR